MKLPPQPTITKLEVMPYWRAYVLWSGHYADCAQCSAVMDRDSGGSGMIPDLCPTGAVFATRANRAVDRQADLADLN